MKICTKYVDSLLSQSVSQYVKFVKLLHDNVEHVVIVNSKLFISFSVLSSIHLKTLIQQSSKVFLD